MAKQAKKKAPKKAKKESGQSLDLALLRSRIDAIDDQFLALLAERAELAQEIGHAKATNGTPPHIPERERAILDRLVAKSAEPLDAASIESVFREIFSVCRALERPVSVAFLGPVGTYSHQAALKHFGSKPTGEPVHTIGEVFDAVERKHADYGVVPVENSTEGSINETLDRLLSTSARICAEVVVEIRHCLLRAPEAEGRPVRKIYSHPQPLAQCRQWLLRHYPAAELLADSSTVRAAERVRGDPEAAAIGGEWVAEQTGLQIFARDIQDRTSNRTRFLVLGNQKTAPSGSDKTSLLLSVKDEAGVLEKILAPFARRKVSLTRIESRPTSGGPWEYVFILDVAGHAEEPRVAKAIQEASKKCRQIKILGAYPRALE
ncbi:MAG: prephenate dehydratase [Bdellovibrionota bacterium]